MSVARWLQAQDEVGRGTGEEGVGESVQELDGGVLKEHDGHESCWKESGRLAGRGFVRTWNVCLQECLLSG